MVKNQLLKPIMPASLLKRALAYFIDVIAVNFVVMWSFKEIISINTTGNFSETYNYLASTPGLTYKLLLVFLAIGTLTILYWAVFEYRLRQSIGKMIMNISVKPLSGELSFRAAVLRNISKISSLLLALDVVYMLYKKTNQRYLEELSDTEVVEGVDLK